MFKRERKDTTHLLTHFILPSGRRRYASLSRLAIFLFCCIKNLAEFKRQQHSYPTHMDETLEEYLLAYGRAVKSGVLLG